MKRKRLLKSITQKSLFPMSSYFELRHYYSKRASVGNWHFSKPTPSPRHETWQTIIPNKKVATANCVLGRRIQNSFQQP
jgi:hypothetical protein